MRGREVRHAGPGPLPAGAADDARHAASGATHYYVRHGTTTLFAAFNIADGSVIAELHRQHRAVEFRKFLIAIDKAVPADLDVHLICDNLATHKTPAIKAWLARHPRFHLHFTPTGSSWINQVERWFGFLTDQLIRRGVHQSVVALENDVRALDHQLERRPETVHLDQDRRGHPPVPIEIYREDLRRRTLGEGVDGSRHDQSEERQRNS